MARANPVQIEAALKDQSSFFDDETAPTFPHTGRLLNETLATYLVDRTREAKRVPAVELAFQLRTPPIGEGLEAEIRTQIETYFSQEAELAALDVRVNRTEGRASFIYALPILALTGLFAGLLYLFGASIPFFIAGAAYLFFITIVWVMLWDPIEKYLFDAYLARLRKEALQKLAKAPIRFTYTAH